MPAHSTLPFAVGRCGVGNQRTEKERGSGSPMTSFFVKAAGPVVCERGEMEYAAPESMTPESCGWRWCLGVECSRMFIWVLMCR